MRILGLVRGTVWNKLDAIQYYRAFLPLREINRHDNGIEARVMNDAEIMGKTDDELGGYDLYVMARMYHGDCEEFIEVIHQRGAKLVLDSDDDLTETYRMVSGRGVEFRKVLGLVDHVTCSTQALADHFAQYTKEPPVVLKNHIDADWYVEMASKAKRVAEGLAIGFSGLLTRWGDWYIPAVPFQRIARDFDVVPIVQGEAPQYMKYLSGDMLELRRTPYSLYPILLAEFDIVLCAVNPDDEFNSGKSALKALESMAVGAVPICSRFGPYMDLYDAGAPIVIVEENSRDAWYEAMADLIRDEPRRLALRARGPDWVRENRDMCRSGHKLWADFYRSIIE